MLSEKDRDTQCHAKAKSRGQLTFTLVEQDQSAPEVICEWVKRNIYTCPLPKLLEAVETAYNMARSTVIKKAAD